MLKPWAAARREAAARSRAASTILILLGRGRASLLGAGAGHTVGAGRGHTQVSIAATWADTQTKEWAAATLLRMPSILMSAILALGYHYHLS